MSSLIVNKLTVALVSVRHIANAPIAYYRSCNDMILVKGLTKGIKHTSEVLNMMCLIKRF